MNDWSNRLALQLDAAEGEIDRLRAEVEELKRDLSGVTEECANLLKIKARVEIENSRIRAEIERLKAENERIETEAHGIDESLSLLSQQYKTLEAENERLNGCIFTDEFIAGVAWRTCRICGERHRRDAMSHGNLCPARKAGEESLPTIEQMAGSNPNFTGDQTTAEYLREIGRTGEEPR